MNPDHIVAALMIGGALVWPLTGWLRNLRLRAEAEREDAENQARWDLEREADLTQFQQEMWDDPYDHVVSIQGHRHSEPVCAWPDCETYLTRDEMAALLDAGARR